MQRQGLTNKIALAIIPILIGVLTVVAVCIAPATQVVARNGAGSFLPADTELL